MPLRAAQAGAQKHHWQAHPLAGLGRSGAPTTARGRDENGAGAGVCSLTEECLEIWIGRDACLSNWRIYKHYCCCQMSTKDSGLLWILGSHNALQSSELSDKREACGLCQKPCKVLLNNVRLCLTHACYSLLQVGKVLANDPSGRAAFVHSGGLAAVQQMAEAPGSKLKEAVEIINSCYPEVRCYAYTFLSRNCMHGLHVLSRVLGCRAPTTKIAAAVCGLLSCNS